MNNKNLNVLAIACFADFMNFLTIASPLYWATVIGDNSIVFIIVLFLLLLLLFL